MKHLLILLGILVLIFSFNFIGCATVSTDSDGGGDEGEGESAEGEGETADIALTTEADANLILTQFAEGIINPSKTSMSAAEEISKSTLVAAIPSAIPALKTKKIKKITPPPPDCITMCLGMEYTQAECEEMCGGGIEDACQDCLDANNWDVMFCCNVGSCTDTSMCQAMMDPCGECVNEYGEGCNWDPSCIDENCSSVCGSMMGGGDPCSDCMMACADPNDTACIDACVNGPCADVGSYATFSQCPPNDPTCGDAMADRVCTDSSTFILQFFMESSDSSTSGGSTSGGGSSGVDMTMMIDMLNQFACADEESETCITDQLTDETLIDENNLTNVYGTVSFNVMDTMPQEDQAMMQDAGMNLCMPDMTFTYDIYALWDGASIISWYGSFNVEGTASCDMGFGYTFEMSMSGNMAFNLDFVNSTFKLFQHFKDDSSGGNNFMYVYKEPSNAYMKNENYFCMGSSRYTMYGQASYEIEEDLETEGSVIFKAGFKDLSSSLSSAEEAVYCGDFVDTNMGWGMMEASSFSTDVLAKILITDSANLAGTLEAFESTGTTTWGPETYSFNTCFDGTSCTLGECASLDAYDNLAIDTAVIDELFTDYVDTILEGLTIYTH